MALAHGGFNQSSKPLRPRRVTSRVVGHNFLSVAVHRRHGTLEEIARIPGKIQDELDHFHAEYLYSDTISPTYPGEVWEGFLWCDWYRVPLGKWSATDLTRCLKGKGIFAIHHNSDAKGNVFGHEMKPSGAGVDTTRAKQASNKRKLVDACQKARKLPERFLRMFSSLAPLSEREDKLPSDWSYSGALWLTLCEKHPFFSRVYDRVYGEYASLQQAFPDLDTVPSQVREMLDRAMLACIELDDFIKSHLPKDKEESKPDTTPADVRTVTIVYHGRDCPCEHCVSTVWE